MKHLKPFAARVLALALCAALALSLLPTTAHAAGTAPVKSRNLNAQHYDTFGRTMRSCLYENSAGGLTRVESWYDTAAGWSIVVEDYDSQLRIQASRAIPMELPIWGGFFAGENYNFVIFGQENKEENDSKEVVRVVKYSKDWQRLGSASLRGANTVIPFDAGSVRCAECGGYLYVRTAHEMYTSKDGKNHQASMMLLVREGDMAITDTAYRVNDAAGVSHSFNQFVLTDREGRIVTLDQGDGYPRSLVLQRLIAPAGQDSFTQEKHIITSSGPGWEQGYIVYEERAELQTFPGSVGANNTGCSVGGFAETANGYGAAYVYDGMGKALYPRDVYFGFVGKDLSVKTTRLTTGADAVTPQLAPTGPDGGYVLWNQKEIRYTPQGGSYPELSDTLYYARYDADGNVGPVRTAKAPLSDCAPIVWNGRVVWYVTNNSAPTFYLLDGNGVTARAAGGGPAPDPNTAYLNTQTVLLDGKPVLFQTYALKDANGGLTNYIKLRDLAWHLSGTRARFTVDWQPGQISLTPGGAYYANGSELSTPFFGDQPYKAGTDKTVVDGTVRAISSIVLTDDKGGAYTYYQLRDLGRNLGFNVSYIDGQVVLNTNEPYSDAQ